MFIFILISVCVATAENSKPDSGYPDYLIKWESLPYSEATWEDGALIVKKYTSKIREFREREDSKRTPSKLCRALKTRPKFCPLKEQPDFIGGDEVQKNINCHKPDWEWKLMLVLFDPLCRIVNFEITN